MPTNNSAPLVNVPKPIYVPPNTQHIRVTPSKREREDENNSFSVVGSVKRIKPLDAVGGCKSTPRAMKDIGVPKLLEARSPPSIHNASEHLDAMFGYDSQTEKQKHYEYGSDTDEEDPPSDTDEPMLSADDAAAAASSPDGEVQPVTDISDEDAFRAEIDKLFVASDKLVNEFFPEGSDSDGEESDDKPELDTIRVKVVEEKGKVIEWAKPGPSPLRHEADLSPERPKRLTLIVRKKKEKKKLNVIPIQRSSRHAQGVDREDVRRRALGRCVYLTMPLPCVEFPKLVAFSEKAKGKMRAPAPADDATMILSCSSPFWTNWKKKRGMGCGTPPRFERWTPLTPPPSRYGYVYSSPDATIPYTRFGPAAFHGARAWGTLFRTGRRSTQFADTRTWAGFAGPVRHPLVIGVGPTRRVAEMHADARALQHLRANGVELQHLPLRVPKAELRRVTTGVMLKEAAIVRAIMGMERARTPEAEPLVDEDVLMDMAVGDEDDFEELGPWLPYTEPYTGPEFVVGGTWCQ